MKAERNRQFAMMSAIAMLAVLAGHSRSWGGLGQFLLWLEPYSYHLPLFAFISGYFYRKIDRKTYPIYLWKKVKRLLIPLFVYNISYGILVQIVKLKGFTYGQSISLKSLFYLPLVSQHQFAFNCPAWYLFPIFVCMAIYPGVRFLVGKRKSADMLVLGVSFVVFVAVFNTFKFDVTVYNGEWRVLFLRIFLLFPFFHIGYLFKLYFEKIIQQINAWKLLLASYIFRFFLLLLAENHLLSYEICWGSDLATANPVIKFLGSLNGILIVYLISGILVNIIKTEVYLKISNHTYDIMMNHLLGFFCVNCILGLWSKVYPIDFDWMAFKTDIYYQFTPFEQFNILYVIAGLAVSGVVIICKARAVKLWKSWLGKRKYVPQVKACSLCKRD